MFPRVWKNNAVYISSTYLHTLITGTSSHSPAMIIIRHIMDQIFVFRMDLASDKHVFAKRSDSDGHKVWVFAAFSDPITIARNGLKPSSSRECEV